MSKSVLISIQPKWCELIANGKKTVEVRKTRPNINTPFKCYIYCTKNTKLQFWTGKRYSYVDDHSHNAFDTCGNAKVIGEFMCNEIIEIFAGVEVHNELPSRPIENWLDWDGEDDIPTAACLSPDEIMSYLNHEYTGYVWYISDLKIYDKPRELSEFYVYCDRCDKHPISCEYGYEENTENGYYSECGCDFKRPIKRPPQSWRYVEEVKGNA